MTSPSSLVVSFDAATLGAAVHKTAPLLQGLPAGVDPARLLWAFCGNESSFGKNCTPRHEPAYDHAGVYGRVPVQAALLAAYGAAGACSYGPMQLMLVNAPAGTHPEAFSDPVAALTFSTAALNKTIRYHKPYFLAELAMCWNAGHIIVGKPSPGVAAYVAQFLRNYEAPAVPLPGEV